MSAAVRFIHTADWQLGLRAHFIPGENGAAVREARLRSVQKIGALAREIKADFVVVAGDVFEHHGLRPDTVRRALDKMGEIPAPVYLLPGNHDPLTPEALYRSDRWTRECPKNVRVLGSTAPVIVKEGVAILPCPLMERHTLGDVTEHLSPDFGPRDHLRIGVAHGGIKEFLERVSEHDDEPMHNLIPVDLAERAGLDYLALGDWHGRLQINERTWYSGTHEATRFKERDPGKVLIVEVGGRGEKPVVSAQEVCTYRWSQHRFTVETAEEIAAVERFLVEHPGRGETLIELTLEGMLSVELRNKLEQVLTTARDYFRFLRVRDEKLHSFLGEQDLASLPSEGWLGRVVERLKAGLPDRSAEDSARALRMLYRFHKEAT